MNGLGVEKNEIYAYIYFKLLAEQENSDGQYGLGYCYEKGIGVKKDLNEAKKYYGLSAIKNN